MRQEERQVRTKTEASGMVTLPEVARHAGVSTATAARALGGYGSVRESTRERVEAVALELGYRPNSLARSMITGSTRTLGVVLSDIENPSFRRSLRGIADTARGRGFEVLLANTDEELEKEETAVTLMTERRVDGLVVCPADSGDRTHLRAVIEAGIPVVLLDRKVAGLRADTVGIDNRKAARTATSYLIEQGHRDIAILTGGTPEMLERMLRPDMRGVERLSATTVGSRAAGFRDAMVEADLPIRPEYLSAGGFRREDAEAQTDRLVALVEPPTAILSFDAMQSLGAYHAISRAGIRCPEDISLLGFDDAEWADVVSPGLTVMAQPTYEIGVAACEILLWRVGGADAAPTHRRLPTELVERGSVAAPPR
jgi:LacI family transcriptional regulator